MTILICILIILAGLALHAFFQLRKAMPQKDKPIEGRRKMGCIGECVTFGTSMTKNKQIKLYNLLFPIWLLIWFPLLWIILIPANYAIDYLVLHLSLKGNKDQKTICGENTWKICLTGFFSDFVGSTLLFLVMLLGGENAPQWLQEVGPALNMNPFRTIEAFLITTGTVAISAVVIYLLDGYVLRKAGLTKKQVRKSALYLAAFTAPYLFFIPSRILYI